MKPFFYFLLLFGLVLPARAAEADPGCAQVSVQARVEVRDGEFSLADLLTPEVCAGVHRAAARIALGRAPLPGSARVFTGAQIRLLLQDSLSPDDGIASVSRTWSIPERVTIRLAGLRASCDDLAALLGKPSMPPALRTSAGENSPPRVDCGAADRIRREAQMAVARTSWSQASGSWQITARCLQPKDCVPFLISAKDRSRAGGPGDRSLADSIDFKKPEPAFAEQTLVRPGQKMTLLWDQDGIQVTLRVVCLDRGGPGEIVRARAQDSDRVLRATVISRDTLRIRL
jgi:hypothetical protein